MEIREIYPTRFREGYGTPPCRPGRIIGKQNESKFSPFFDRKRH